jgi:hypothetical protein
MWIVWKKRRLHEMTLYVQVTRERQEKAENFFIHMQLSYIDGSSAT